MTVTAARTPKATWKWGTGRWCLRRGVGSSPSVTQKEVLLSWTRVPQADYGKWLSLTSCRLSSAATLLWPLQQGCLDMVQMLRSPVRSRGWVPLLTPAVRPPAARLQAALIRICPIPGPKVHQQAASSSVHPMLVLEHPAPQSCHGAYDGVSRLLPSSWGTTDPSLCDRGTIKNPSSVFFWPNAIRVASRCPLLSSRAPWATS